MLIVSKNPDNFNMKEYLCAFRQLAPIPGINRDIDDDMTVYVANCAFTDYVKMLETLGYAKNKGSVWVILNEYKSELIRMNVLPIAIFSGAKIYFVEEFPEMR